MQYQISYLSPRGYAQELAEEFLELLPKDTTLQRLDREPSTSADVHLVGFEFGSTNLDVIPYDVIDFLDKLDNRVIFMFAPFPFRSMRPSPDSSTTGSSPSFPGTVITAGFIFLPVIPRKVC